MTVHVRPRRGKSPPLARVWNPENLAYFRLRRTLRVLASASSAATLRFDAHLYFVMHDPHGERSSVVTRLFFVGIFAAAKAEPPMVDSATHQGTLDAAVRSDAPA